MTSELPAQKADSSDDLACDYSYSETFACPSLGPFYLIKYKSHKNISCARHISEFVDKFDQISVIDHIKSNQNSKYVPIKITKLETKPTTKVTQDNDTTESSRRSSGLPSPYPIGYKGRDYSPDAGASILS